MSSVKSGTTSRTEYFNLVEKTAGTAKTGVTINQLLIGYTRTRQGNVSTNCSALPNTSASWSSAGAIEVDTTNAPGLYRVDVPDGAYSTAAGVDTVILTLYANTTTLSVAPAMKEVQLDITVSSVTGNVGGAVGSVTGNVGGAVGSVTGNVGGSVGSVVGNVGGSVNSVVTSVLANSVTGNVGGSVGSVVGNVGGSVASVTNTVTATVSATVNANVTAFNGDQTSAANIAKTTRAIGRGTVTTGGSTTSIPTSAFAPSGSVADQFKGRIITFDADTTTAALRGQATDITASSNSSTPTFTVTALTTAPASGDTFSIT